MSCYNSNKIFKLKVTRRKIVFNACGKYFFVGDIQRVCVQYSIRFVNRGYCLLSLAFIFFP